MFIKLLLTFYLIMKSLNHLIIGCYRRGQEHIEVTDKLSKQFNLIGLCDKDPEKLKSYSKYKTFTDIRKAIELKPDSCTIALPPELHHIFSVYLTRRKIHHIIETPIAASVKCIKLMEKAQKENPEIKIQISENFPFLPIEHLTRNLIEENVIGKVHRCFRLFTVTTYHGLACMRKRLNAIPVSVGSFNHMMPTYTDMQNSFSDNLELHMVSYKAGEFGLALLGDKQQVCGRNTFSTFETHGEFGTIITSGKQSKFGGEKVFSQLYGGKFFEVQREFGQKTPIRLYVSLEGKTVEWINPYPNILVKEKFISMIEMLDSFYQAIINNKPMNYSLADGKIDQETYLGSKRAARLGKQIKLPLTEDKSEESTFEEMFYQKYGIGPFEEPDSIIDHLLL